MKNFLIIISFLSVISSGMASKNEPLLIYHDANIAYQKLNYDSAIVLYEKLVIANTISTEVYYNLGNAYFKKGDFAKAILNYERAKKLDADDDDANFNLKIASLKVVDKIENVPEIFYKRWINQISVIVGPDTWSTILITMIWLLFVAAALYIFGQTVSAKKISFVLIVSIFSLSCITGLMASRSHAIASIDEHAIIMASSVYVKSSPDLKGNDLFILHEGTKIDVLDELNAWKKIRIANGSIGWIRREDIEII